MPLAAGLLHAVLMFLAFEPVGFWPCAFLAPLPTLLLASKAVSLRGALLFGAGCIPFWLYHHWFIKDITGPGFIPLVLYLAAWDALAVWLLARVRAGWPKAPGAVLAPIVLTGLDLLRGEVALTGYAWYLPGQPLIDSPLTGLGSSIGLYGTGMIVLAVASCLVSAARGRGRPRILWGAAALALTGSMVDLPGTPPGHAPLRVAVVQTNVPQSNKMAWSATGAAEDYGRLLRLTRAAAANKPDLIVWPETMKFGWVLTDDQIREVEGMLAGHPDWGRLRDEVLSADLARTAAKEAGVPLILGQETMVGPEIKQVQGRDRLVYKARYNSSYLIVDGVPAAERYDKLEPTPFGENLPYVWRWPWLRDTLTDLGARGMRIDLSAGTERTVFKVPVGGSIVRAVTPICFESTDAGLCRSLVYEGGARRADLIVCMTNDGWFGASHSGRMHHLQLARWRCLELGTPMVRAANTGYSAVIDASGRLRPAVTEGPEAIGTLPVDKDGVLSGVLFGMDQTSAGPTMYGRVGNLAGWGSFVGCVILTVTAWRRLRAQRGPAGPGGEATTMAGAGAQGGLG